MTDFIISMTQQIKSGNAVCVASVPQPGVRFFFCFFSSFSLSLICKETINSSKKNKPTRLESPPVSRVGLDS